MLNETVSEYLDTLDAPCGNDGCPCGADAYRQLLTRLFGPAVLDMRTSSGFGSQVKQAVQAAHEQPTEEATP